MREGRYLSLPDPCQHVTRLQLVAARLEDGEELDELLDHIEKCVAQKGKAK